jgi:phage terminase large subunit-like protein
MESPCVFFAKHYLPELTIELPHNAHYRKWRDQGWLIETDGARTDFRRIESDLQDIASMFSVQALAYDPREASYLISSIEEWASFECVEITQGPAQMSEPMKEMEAATSRWLIAAWGDPVLTWMMGNVVKKQGRIGGPVKYYYPTKEREAAKIDGIVAGIMALSRAMVRKTEPSFQMLFV